jgi:hypothetical protein
MASKQLTTAEFWKKKTCKTGIQTVEAKKQMVNYRWKFVTKQNDDEAAAAAAIVHTLQ